MKHTWTAIYGKPGEAGHFRESHSHDDPDQALKGLRKKVVARFVYPDDKYGNEHLIGTKEAQDMVRFETKLGNLKWLKKDSE